MEQVDRGDRAGRASRANRASRPVFYSIRIFIKSI